VASAARGGPIGAGGGSERDLFGARQDRASKGVGRTGSRKDWVAEGLGRGRNGSRKEWVAEGLGRGRNRSGKDWVAEGGLGRGSEVRRRAQHAFGPGSVRSLASTSARCPVGDGGCGTPAGAARWEAPWKKRSRERTQGVLRRGAVHGSEREGGQNREGVVGREGVLELEAPEVETGNRETDRSKVERSRKWTSVEPVDRGSRPRNPPMHATRHPPGHPPRAREPDHTGSRSRTTGGTARPRADCTSRRGNRSWSTPDRGRTPLHLGSDPVRCERGGARRVRGSTAAGANLRRTRDRGSLRARNVVGGWMLLGSGGQRARPADPRGDPRLSGPERATVRPIARASRPPINP
jgi:hypothetical protein